MSSEKWVIYIICVRAEGIEKVSIEPHSILNLSLMPKCSLLF